MKLKPQKMVGTFSLKEQRKQVKISCERRKMLQEVED